MLSQVQKLEKNWDSADFIEIFQDFHFDVRTHNVCGAVLGRGIEMKKRKRSKKEPELRFSPNLADANL